MAGFCIARLATYSGRQLPLRINDKCSEMHCVFCVEVDLLNDELFWSRADDLTLVFVFAICCFLQVVLARV